MSLSYHGINPQQIHMPPPLPLHQRPKRPVSAISPPPQRPPPRCRRPKSHCVASLPPEPSFAIVRSFDHCPISKRPTRSFEDTKLRIPDARQRLSYLENQCKSYAKADSDMTKWIKRVSAKGPPIPVLEGYVPSRRQSPSSIDDLSSQARTISSNSSSNRPQPNPSFSTSLTTFLRKAASGSISSSTRRPHSAIGEPPRPSLSRMLRPSSFGRLSISISTKPKGTITKEKTGTKTAPSLSAAGSPPLYQKPEQKEQQQHQLPAKRWRPGSVMGSLRMPSSTKSENTRRPVSIATVVDPRALPLETKTADRRLPKKVAETPTSSSQSFAQRKRTVAPSLAPMYLSAAWR